MLTRLYRFVRPLLMRLDPEAAHEWSVRALEAAASVGLYASGRPAGDVPALRQRLFGLEFPNPVGLAAGYDKDARVPAALLGLGFGFAEVGTVTPRPQPGNPRPRLFRLVEDRAVINRFGFNSAGHGSALDRLSKRQPGKAGRARAIVGVNIGANKDTVDKVTDYVSGYRAFAPVADYVTVNISSPNTPGLRDLQSAGELGRLLASLREARQHVAAAGHRTPPLLLKIAPDLDDAALAEMVETAIANSIDGLIVSNTTLARPSLKSRHAGEAGGLSGKPLFAMSTAVLAKAHVAAAGRLPLIGVGGIFSAEDALTKIEAGASLVQLYTALVYEGPGLIKRIKRDLVPLMAKRGYAGIGEAVGVRAAELAASGG